MAFGAPAHGAGLVQIGCCRVTAGQHERAQWFQVVIQLVNFSFQAVDLGLLDAQRLPGKFLVGIGRSQVGAKIEHVVLGARQHGIKLAHVVAGGMQPGDSEDRIGLVDGAVAGDAGMELGQPLTGGQRRGPVIPGLGINLVQNHHDLSILRLGEWLCGIAGLYASATAQSTRRTRAGFALKADQVVINPAATVTVSAASAVATAIMPENCHSTPIIWVILNRPILKVSSASYKKNNAYSRA